MPRPLGSKNKNGRTKLISYVCKICYKIFSDFKIYKREFCSNICRRKGVGERISKALMGHEVSKETREKISKTKDKGSTNYWALHSWIESKKGKPQKCEHCETTEAKKFEWANKSHEYKRDLSDWLRLCTKCHRKYDSVFAHNL